MLTDIFTQIKELIIYLVLFIGALIGLVLAFTAMIKNWRSTKRDKSERGPEWSIGLRNRKDTQVILKHKEAGQSETVDCPADIE